MTVIPVLWMAVLITSLAMGMTTRAPKPCCYPDQYEAGVSAITGQIQSGTPVALTLYMYGGWDLKNGQQGFQMYINYPNGTSINFRIIQKFAEKAQWVILDSVKYCQKQPLVDPEPLKCVPDNATTSITIQIGGPQGILLDSWTYVYPDAPGPYRGTASISVVSGGSCIPFGSTFMGDLIIGSTIVPMVTSTGVLNITMGIPDPAKWFTVPSFCNSEETLASPLSEDIRNFVDMHNKRLF